MKRIAFIVHGLGNGGAERVASILASEFSRRNNEVLYLAVYNNTITYSIDKRIDYRYLNIEDNNKIIKYIKRSKKILEILEKYKPEVIISFITQEMILAGLKYKQRIIFSERTDPAMKPWKTRLVTKWLYERSYKVVFQTSGARGYFSEKIKNKSSIIPNPMCDDLPYWRDNEHKKTIVTACRITPEKNLPMLITAFAKFHEVHNDYVLQIYGEPRSVDVKDKLIRLTLNLKINDFVEFPGYKSNIHQVIAESGIFVLTSNYEGLSNSMLEALCIGIPTICTDCPSGGARMFIEDGENGFLVDVNNVKMLYEKMTLLANDVKLQNKISNASIELRNQLSIDYIMTLWEKVIQ